MYKTAFTLIFIMIIAAPLFSQNSGGGGKKNATPIWLSDCEKKLDELRKTKEVKPISQFPPFFGKKIRDKGYTLPLPFGVGVSFIVMRQTNQIDNFNLILDNQEIPIDIKFYDAVSTDMNFTFRPDIWILPFLNVYGVFGYTTGSIKPSILIPGIQADLPVLGEVDIIKPIELNDEIKYNGSTVGIGSTLAGGFKSYFFTLDYNYTWTKLDVIPTVIEVQTITPRIGILLEGLSTSGTGTFWIGAMYIDLYQAIEDNFQIDDKEVSDIIGNEVGYKMNLTVAEPLNYIIGGAWQFNPRMTLVLEAGVGDRSQFLVSIDYRF